MYKKKTAEQEKKEDLIVRIINEEKFLDFSRLFIDGTDALVNGSIHYKITWDEITMLQYAKQWKILHNNRKQSMERFMKELKKKQEFYKDDEEMTKLIKMALERPDIYNKRIYKKIPLFTEALMGRKQNYVSIMFPESIMMRTKKGKFDFALNLQQIMLKNNDIIAFWKGFQRYYSTKKFTYKELLQVNLFYYLISLFFNNSTSFSSSSL